MGKITEINNKIIPHPGNYFEDFISFEGKTIEQCAVEMDISTTRLRSFISGHYNVDRCLAKKLEEYTGIDSKTWRNLQSSFNKAYFKLRIRSLKERAWRT